MKVYIIRHSWAVSAQNSAGVDRDRWLTLKGRRIAESVASTLAAKNLTPDLILVSPYARALQTAEIVAAGIGFNGMLSVTQSLIPSDDTTDIESILASIPDEHTVILFSHEPMVSSLTGMMTGTFTGFRPGQVRLVEHSEVQWSFDPNEASPGSL